MENNLKNIYITESLCQVVRVVKNPPANARDIRDVGLIPGSGRSPGGGYGNPLQDSCLENPRTEELSLQNCNLDNVVSQLYFNKKVKKYFTVKKNVSCRFFRLLLD